MKVLKSLFTSSVKNLRISEFQDVNPLTVKISSPNLKSNKGSHFHFSCVSLNDVFEEVKKKLGIRKATQSTDIPVNIMKENANIFAEYSKVPELFCQKRWS